MNRLLRGIPRHDPRVLLGGGVGEDAAVIDFGAPPLHGLRPQRAGTPPAAASAGVLLPPGPLVGDAVAGDDRLLIAKTDPVTFATDLIGWYAVHVNANDVACAGATPRWFLATALLPRQWEEREIAALFEQLVQACTSLGVTLVGGHTEITGGLERPIVVGCMLGEVERARAIHTAGAQAGDDLLLTQGVAVEGTAVLARETAGRLRALGVAGETIARAQQLLFTPGISVVGAAQALCQAVPPPEGLHSLHDPTEGGLASGVRELVEASGLGAVVDAGALEVLPETRAICDALSLDPLGLLASGALLAAVAPGATTLALATLQERGIPARVVGRLMPREEGLWIAGPTGERRAWPHFDRDEVARYLDEFSTDSG
ncbi:MAG: AIR synthase related protein [Chloroflexota bacterium]|nr:AIR synthase related protein [Chloroflexota bacterium]